MYNNYVMGFINLLLFFLQIEVTIVIKYKLHDSNHFTVDKNRYTANKVNMLVQYSKPAAGADFFEVFSKFC